MKSVNMMEEVEVRLHFERKSIKLGDEVIDENVAESGDLFAESSGIQEN